MSLMIPNPVYSCDFPDDKPDISLNITLYTFPSLPFWVATNNTFPFNTLSEELLYNFICTIFSPDPTEKNSEAVSPPKRQLYILESVA